MSANRAPGVRRPSAQTLVGQVFSVRFERGRDDGPIGRIKRIIALPDSTWPGTQPQIGQTILVRVVGADEKEGSRYCFVLPVPTQSSGQNEPKAAVVDEEFFSLPEIPPDAVRVRFKYRGKRLLGNHNGRGVDPNWKGWGATRQPKIHETWLVKVVLRPNQEIGLAVAVQGPLKKKH